MTTRCVPKVAYTTKHQIARNLKFLMNIVLMIVIGFQNVIAPPFFLKYVLIRISVIPELQIQIADMQVVTDFG